MTLREKQSAFALRVGKLILKAYDLGFELAFGEAERPPEVAKYYASIKKGSATSLHISKLAVDFDLFKDGVFQRKTEAYRDLGLYWESLSTEDLECCWGGRFGDGNHFSIRHGGMR